MSYSYFKDLLESAVYVPKIKCRDKKDLLHKISYLMLENQGFSIDFIENVFNSFVYREYGFATTGLERGIALPHARWCGNFLQLGFFTVDPPIDYDSFDKIPVYVISALLIPEYIVAKEYMKVLAYLAEMVSDALLMSNIIQLEAPDQLKSRIINWTPPI